MHFLVLGSNGFLGRHIVAELLAGGHEVTGAARHPGALARTFPRIATMRLDLGAPGDDLASRLQGVDVIVNVAGQLQGRGLAAVHVHGPAAVYRAAAQAKVKRIILISAISAREDVPTEYAQSKLQGEAVLKEAGLPWTILKPSLIVAKGSYGGTSVLRGLAGLPLVAPIMDLGDARFSPIHARDVARTVATVAADPRFEARMLEPAGPQTVNLTELVRAYRGWLGFKPGIEVRLPPVLLRSAARLGDLLGGGPISTTSLDQLAAGNAGDGSSFAAAVGFAPRGLSQIHETEPADVQDRWHARLFFLAILVKATLILTWVVSAIVGLFFGAGMASAFAHALGLPQDFAWPLILLTCALDLAAAAVLLLDRRGRLAFWLQLTLVVGYTLGLTLLMPGLWLDPFGPLLKNLAVLALIGINGVLSEER